jgi:hypothetical protein
MGLGRMTERLRIATWNLDHAANSKRPLELQVKQILSINADILVLTETCKDVDLASHGFKGFTSAPNDYGKFYSAIYLGPRISLQKQLNTYDETTATCIQVNTPLGEMIIYGTIITYHGDKGPNNDSPAWAEHYKAIEDQSKDWKRIGGKVPLFVAGDFNQTRDESARTYGTKKGRELLGIELNTNHLTCLTTVDFGAKGKLKDDPKKGWPRNSVDHICMTDNAFKVVEVGAWDHFNKEGQYLSDHNGVYVDIQSY